LIYNGYPINLSYVGIIAINVITIHASRGETSSRQSPVELRRGTIHGSGSALGLGTTLVAVGGAKVGEQLGLADRFRGHQPEEGVVLHARLP